jgi:ABC-2 type transport system permease protein
VLLGRTEELVVPVWAAQLSPLAGPLLLVLGIAVFRGMSRWYSSPGH